MIQTEKLPDLKNYNCFKVLNDSELNLLVNISNTRFGEKGKIIYEEGMPKKYVYFLLKGTVKLGSNTSSGKTLIKDLIHDGSLFGENIFSGNDFNNEFAQCVSKITYLEIPIDYFKKLSLANSDFAEIILQLIINKLHSLEERMRNFVFKNAKERIVDFIKKTANKSGIRIGIDETLINHGMSHKEIALLTDTSRQTVARVLGELKKANQIHFSPRKPNKILIRDMSALG